MSSSTSHLYLTRTADGTHSPGSKARDSSAVFASQELFEIRDFLRSPSSHREESTRPITSLINKFLNIRMNVVYDSSSTRVSVERAPIGTIMQDSVKPSNQHTSPRLAVASTLYALPHTPCNRLGAENLVRTPLIHQNRLAAPRSIESIRRSITRAITRGIQFYYIIASLAP
jgi:hypothetical protein